MTIFKRGLILLLCLGFFLPASVENAYALEDTTTPDMYIESSEYDDEEMEALEKKENATDVFLVLKSYNEFFEKLETNQKEQVKEQKKHNKKVKEQKRKQKIENIVNFAMKQRGKRYVWGATGPNTFDCSGLMKYVFNHYGYSLPRVSAAQAQIGKHLSYSQLKRGDLVFFRNSKEARISHVGMYLGNGQYIHAPTSGDVVKVSPMTGWARSHFAWGVRVVN